MMQPDSRGGVRDVEKMRQDASAEHVSWAYRVRDY